MLDIIAVPFGYLMRFCYSITGNYAIALIFFTLLFKLILLPLSIKQQKSTRDRARIQPKEKAIRKRYVGRTDQNAQMEMSNDIMKLYRDEKVSMASGCLPVLIQLPIIAVIYQIISAGSWGKLHLNTIHPKDTCAGRKYMGTDILRL